MTVRFIIEPIMWSIRGFLGPIEHSREKKKFKQICKIVDCFCRNRNTWEYEDETVRVSRCLRVFSNNCNFELFPDLIHCTNEMNVNIPQLADSLFERTTNTSWVVVFKSLITTHHLMVYGNEVKYLLASSPSHSSPEFPL